MSCKHEKLIEIKSPNGLCREECESCGGRVVLDYANEKDGFVPFKVLPIANVIDFKSYKEKRKAMEAKDGEDSSGSKKSNF